MKLSTFINGRDNNYQLIRFIAALMVLFSHSYALVYGTSDAEPLNKMLGMSPGSIAVDIFFMISGFLVTNSILFRKSTSEFIVARLLRIYPALIVMVLLLTILLGIFFSSVSTTTFVKSGETKVFLLKNLTMIAGPSYQLPGVFESVPYRRAVNGSLWTLPYELRMYAVLAIIWSVLHLTGRLRPVLFRLSLPLLATTAFVAYIVRHYYLHAGSSFLKLSLMFFMGASYYILKDYVSLRHRYFILAIFALAISTVNRELFFIVYLLTIAYILFFIVYVPGGIIRKYNYVGDYSYGVYIYAFPIQQIVISTIPNATVSLVIVLSSIITIMIAAFSWHFVEERALRLKGSLAGFLKKLHDSIRIRKTSPDT